MSKSIRTAKRSYTLECGTDGWIAPPSGPTSEPSTEWRGVEAWIVSLEASPANPSAPLASNEGPTTLATSGPKSRGSFARYDRDSRFWRTYQGSFTEPTGAPYSETWPRAGTTFNGTVSQQTPRAPLTDAIGSGFLLPTPVQADATMGAILNEDTDIRQTTGLPRKYSKQGSNGSVGLARLVQLWPTPQATDWKRNGGDSEQRRDSPNLPAMVGGKLNPPWVEWLMGFPLGWTGLQPLEML